MNICIFIDSPLDAPGGTVQSVLNQKTVLEQAGHHVSIVCLGKRIIDDPNIYYARPYFSLINDDVNFAYLISNPMTTARVYRFLIRQRIDIIHVESESTTAALGVTLARRMNIPVIATVHNYFWPATGPLQFLGGLLIESQVLLFAHRRLRLSRFGNNRLERAIRGLTEQVCRQVDTVIAPSQHLAHTLREGGITTPIRVLPNPYVVRDEVPEPTILRRGAARRFVWIGRCAPEKRLMEFIEAIGLVAARISQPWQVTIIGGGPDCQLAQERARELQLDEIIEFTGHLPNAEVVAHIDAARVLVLTSYHFDNQPVVVSEAVSRYRGVLYCDERIQEGVATAGYLAEGPDAESLAKAMRELLEQPAIAEQLSRKARRAARDFSGPTYAASLEKVASSFSRRGMV